MCKQVHIYGHNIHYIHRKAAICLCSYAGLVDSDTLRVLLRIALGIQV